MNMDTLHNLMVGWEFIPGAQIKTRLPLIERLLNEGADPNQTNENGATPLGLLVGHTQEVVGGCDIAHLLIAHGANPLAKDQPLLRAGLSTMLGMLVALKWRNEAGVMLTSEDGSGPFHLFPQDNPRALMECMVPGLAGGWKVEYRNWPAWWYTQPRNDGKTPLHCFAAGVMGEDAGPAWTHKAPPHVALWMICKTFVQYDPSVLDRRDNEGRSGASLLARAMAHTPFGTLPEDQPLVDMIQARHQAHTLEALPHAVAKTGRGARL